MDCPLCQTLKTRAARFCSQCGSRLTLTALASDVTQRKLSEEALRLNERRLRLALDIAEMLSWDWAIGENVVVFSQDYGGYYGLAPTGTVVPNDESMLNPVHPDDRGRMTEAFGRLLQTGQDFQIEFRGPPRQGKQTWYVARGHVLETRDGQPQRVIGITQDITLRKQAEQALRQSHEELERLVQERTAELQMILDSVPALIVYQDREQRMIRVNEAHARAYGLRREQIEGKTDFELGSPYADRYRADDLKVVTTGMPLHNVIEPFFTPHGIRWLQSEKVPLRDSNGNVTGQVCLSIDITERKVAEQQVRELRDTLAHANRLGTLSEIASGLAHELNQPLCAIHIDASTAMLLSNELDAPELRQRLQCISDSSFRAGEIVRRMRSFIRRDSSRKEHHNVNLLIREVLSLLNDYLQQGELKVELNLAANLPHVVVDGVQIQQVLVNLIRNATDAMAQNGDQPRVVSIQTDMAESKVRVSVRDAGCGLDSTIAAKLFFPFQSTKPAGLGLGLVICRTIVESHGGCIEAHPNPDRGTTFVFTIPVAS